MHVYTILALDLANARTRDARDLRRAEHLAAEAPNRPSSIRRALAYTLAAISRGSADAARRLDEVTAEEFGRTLSATD